MTLTPGAVSRIQSTSRADVESTVADLRRYFSRSQWLADNNRYARDTVGKVREDFHSTGTFTTRKQQNLSHYIAASGTIHCIDGWGFLGTSLSALLRGDSYTAVHMAYYAELRAAMSGLASDGICVLNKQHASITRPNIAEKLPGSTATHEFAWLALQEWAGKPSVANLMAETITPFLIPLREWFASLPGNYKLQPVARKWVRKWGLDLRRMADNSRGDRQARNDVSYRPTMLLGQTPVDAGSAVRFVRALWRYCEPVGSSKFERLDRLLLRATVRAVFEGRSGNTASSANAEFRAFVDQLVDAQNFPSARGVSEAKDFLKSDPQSEPENILHIAALPITNHPHSHLGVIARAFLLLRISTGIIDYTLGQAGVSNSELSFWKDSLNTGRGISPDGAIPDPATDLWTDIAEALADIESFPTDAANDATYAKLRAEYERPIVQLTGLEAIPMWAIGSV
ncbi:hypothetical protein FG91_01663 [Sphingopyxis sp. LC81]|uniref:hypothetical protein n=1 Tax=Sphingopyxis sp. LC81 TaxID=1502850 RepID=UPI000510436E|nr:hypothetical protein [Sphingopyxis sp. LC81]KGB55033.1 hypothetical protein FG91_01663 [Sphingopyxis sp. LC81]